MGLFDMFSSSAGKDTANKVFGATKDGLNQGFGQARKFAGNASNELRQGRNQALGFLDQGGRQSTRYLQQAVDPWQNILDIANQGAGVYGDAVGANGQEGFDRATENFRTNPGYEFQLNQGLDALDRRAASRGLLASGNNSIDTLTYSQGLADQSYQSYVGNLLPYLNQQTTAAGGLGNAFSNLANNATQLAANKSNVATGTASGLSNIQSGLGSLGYNTQVGIGQAGAQRAQARYAAEQQANQAVWDGILGIANVAATASDRRVKKDIRAVGKLDNGLPVYLFRYRDGGPFQIGLMAQDVEEANPEAVIEHGGVKRVFYERAVAAHA